jgi:hypothetical protein
MVSQLIPKSLKALLQEAILGSGVFLPMNRSMLFFLVFLLFLPKSTIAS